MSVSFELASESLLYLNSRTFRSFAYICFICFLSTSFSDIYGGAEDVVGSYKREYGGKDDQGLFYTK